MSQLKINPVTKDYELDGGKPVNTESLDSPAYIRLKVRRKEWLYAPDDKYGSDLATIKKRHSTQDASAIENVAAIALQPMVDDGRASQIDITADAVYRNAASLQIKIMDAQGKPTNLNLKAIGT